MASPSRVPWLAWGGLILAAALVLAAELYWAPHAPKPPVRVLPVLAKVPAFSFLTETNATMTNDSLAGKIWVADFIFTRCPGPCPVMTEKMRQLQAGSQDMDGGNIRLVSVTVDPSYDTPAVLSKYGVRVGANADRWSFLTGAPDKIEHFITKGMFLGLSKNGDGLPVHSQKFVVVDRQGRIRAYHDLADGALVPDILADLEILGREKQTQSEIK